jgi:hypothetical protein
MKKVAILMLFLSLGLVSVGCDNKPKPVPAKPTAPPDKPADGGAAPEKPADGAN